MTAALESVRAYAEARYRGLFHDKDWTLQSESPCLDFPTWRWQSHGLRDVASLEVADAGLLLDGAIGACLYVVDFSRDSRVRQTISRALAIQQQLLPIPRDPNVPVDELGSWRVTICWLVEENEFSNWIEQLADIRERTGHFEEVSTDVIVRRSESWFQACELHGLPRLLTSVRAALNRKSATEVEDWRNADRAVTHQLEKLIQHQFTSPLAKECMLRAATFALENTSKHYDEPLHPEQDGPVALKTLRVSNFRNLNELEIAFTSDETAVSSTIIHGPNGSGKSSVYEALSFAMTGATERYLNYLEDNNRKVVSSNDTYLTDYLAPRFNREKANINIWLNGNAVSINQSVVEDMRKKVTFGSANFFSQECSRSLVSMPASELAGEVASAFSNVANSAIEYIEQSLKAAQEQQRQFNADWNLHPNTTKEQTVIERVVLRRIEKLAFSIDPITIWLSFGDGDARPFTDRMKQYGSRLADWSEKRVRIASKISLAESSARQTILFNYIEEGLKLAFEAESFLSEIQNLLDSWPPNLETEIEEIGQRLFEQSKATEELFAPDRVENLRVERERLSNALQQVLHEGTVLRARKTGLDAVREMLSEWVPEHSEICPTCSSDVSHQGGIAEVVHRALNFVNSDIQNKRNNFSAIKSALDDITKDLVAIGAEEVSTPESDPSNILVLIHRILRNPSGSEAELTNQNERAELLALIRHIRRVPRHRAENFELNALVDGVLSDIDTVLEQYRRVAALPKAWKEVRDELEERLVGVVASHLPATVQAVWKEIAQNLIPARWQYPGEVSFRPSSGRRGNELTIIVNNEHASAALAAHILNGAEVHNLGFSWFLTRYLMDGRFRMAALVMDDPAHAMDQPTYRDFCRLLETLLRLHRVQGLPISLVLLLHQDSRAVDAARATNGVLHLLRWNKNSAVSLKALKMHDRSTASPLPSSARRTV